MGGIKGSGPDHFLTATWQEILESLEGNDGGAASLTAIDFAKAFNQMSHQACLKSLSDHGASDATTALVSAFYAKERCLSALAQPTMSPEL